ncbi:hypothetical protein B0H19DRAFT_423597 [Mycena capillaripes]|nr:hypothetical protein B0H19DRAFT_423597 [Mycena capillaripes]
MGQSVCLAPLLFLCLPWLHGVLRRQSRLGKRSTSTSTVLARAKEVSEAGVIHTEIYLAACDRFNINKLIVCISHIYGCGLQYLRSQRGSRGPALPQIGFTDPE